MMTTVLLYGSLRKRFGKRWDLDIQSPAEAIRALSVLCPGFRRHLLEYAHPGYHILTDDRDIGAPENLHLGGAKTIKIIPVVQGAKNAIWTIITGIALIAISYFTAGTATPWLATLGSAAGSIGIAMVLGGISQLLFKPPSQGIRDDSGTPSYAFTGPVNTAAQGHPVPVCYGRLRVGSAVISASFHTTALGSDGGNGGDFAITTANPYTWVSGGIALTAENGTPPYTWSLAFDHEGLFSITGSTMNISGSPVGQYFPTVVCTDADGTQIEACIEVDCGGAGESAVSYGLNPYIKRVS